MGEISSSSFEFYEGLRVLVPGGLVVGLYAAVAETFGLGGSVTIGSALVAVLATLAAGFVLLFLDLPARAAVFQYGAPEPHLRSWADVKPPEGASYLNVYYEILDVEVPPGIRNRIHYLGAIYRIGFESVYLAAAAVLVLLVAALFPSVGPVRDENSTTTIRWLFGLAALLHVAIVATALWSRYVQHRDKEPSDAPSRRRDRWAKVARDIDREVPEFDRVLLMIALITLLLSMTYGWRWAGVGSVAIPGGLWALRYYRGVRPSDAPARTQPGRDDDSRHLWTNPWWWLADRRERLRHYFAPTSRPRERANLHAVTAALTFGLASMSLCLIGARHAVSDSPLDAGVVVGWTAATLVAAALITARAHERRLQGGYATQRTWLDRNKEALISNGYFVRTQP